MRWSIDRVHGVVHGPRPCFVHVRKTSGCLAAKRRMTLTRVLFTTNDTRNIIDHGAMTRFPAYSHTNSAIFTGIFEPDENNLAATVCPRRRMSHNATKPKALTSMGRG